TEITGQNTEACQNDEWCGDRLRGFVEMFRMVRINMGGSPEDYEYEPEAVEGGQESRQQTEERQYLTKVSRRPSGHEKVILAEEARRQGEAGERQGPDHKRPVGNRQLVFEAAHVSHVLFMMQRDNDRAAAKEQQGFECAMGE